MVQKPKAQQNPKTSPSHNSDNKNGSFSPKVSLAKLDQLNHLCDHPSTADPTFYYTFYLVDRDWMIDLRRAVDKKIKLKVGPINQDLQKQNYYEFNPKNFLHSQTQHILRNDLHLWNDFEILTPEAWEYLSKNYDGFSIKAKFDAENGRFEETMRFLSFNVIIQKENLEFSSYLVQIKESSLTENIINFLKEGFQIEDSDLTLVLVDTRANLTQILQSLNNGVITGKNIEPQTHYPFKFLKNSEILLLFRTGSIEVIKPEANISGFCSECRKDAKLSYYCSCIINSYCSVDCKCKDYITHRHVCKDFSTFNEDIIQDLSLYAQDPFNFSEIGLENVGNSCYLNCLLQVLKIVPAIREKLIFTDLKSIEHSKFLMGFFHIMRKIQVFKGEGLKPWPLKLAMGLQSAQFLFSQQNDASECLDFILNQLDESKVDIGKEISDTFRGSTIVKFKCKDCLKIESREIEDPFFLFQVSLIPEPPLKEFTLFLFDDHSTGLKMNHLVVCLRENEISLKNIVKKGLGDHDFNKVLITITDKKDDIVVLQNDADFMKYVSDKSYPSEQTIDLNLHIIEPNSKNFLLLNICETIMIAKQYPQQKKIGSSKLIQFRQEDIIDHQKVTAAKVHLRIFQTIKSTFFSVFPETFKIYQELKKLNYKHADEAFYCAVFKIKPQNQKLIDGIEEIKSEEQINEILYHEKLIDQISESINSIVELKQEKFYTITNSHRGQVCSLCQKADSGSCLIEFSHHKSLTFFSSQIDVLRINVEFQKFTKINTAIAKLSDKENLKLLPLSKNSSKLNFDLKYCLESVFSWEKIERKCAGCGSNNSDMLTSVKRLPVILIIHLKRFKQIYDKFGNQKTVKLDEFVNLDFQIFIEGQKYELLSVVNHAGNLNDGHYTSAAFEESTKTWFSYNDSVFMKIEDIESIKQRTNYILFYKRIDGLELI